MIRTSPYPISSFASLNLPPFFVDTKSGSPKIGSVSSGYISISLFDCSISETSSFLLYLKEGPNIA